MLATRPTLPLVLCTVAALAGAQTTITNTYPLVVGSTSPWGGTSIAGVTNDSEHNIVTTVGNPLFPAGNVRISNNGVVVAGITTGDVSPGSAAIPAAGFPSGIPPGAGAILPWMEDLSPLSSTDTIRWKEEGGVLSIIWLNEGQCCPASIWMAITFEVKVYAAPAAGAPWIQVLYFDADFSSVLPLPAGSFSPCDGGACASIGYVAGPAFGSNVQWSFHTASVSNLTVLSVFHDMGLAPSSPLGAGSLKLDFLSGPPNGSYFLAVTLAQGSFPNGWLFGLDITYADLASELASGFPFTGPLDAAGNFSLGPLQGVPPLTFYTVAFGFMPGSPVPAMHTAAVSYAVP